MLFYQGPLKANAGPIEKQQIRRYLHRQLHELWNQKPLRSYTALLKDRAIERELSNIRQVGPFRFAPLVTAELRMIAHLHVIFLRPEEPGALITQGGDIDNRIKTLFDALRMPKDPSEIPKDDVPGVDENPFHCLLEDDNLIISVHVQTERLLDTQVGTNDVLLLIRVTTRLTERVWANTGFE